MNAYWQIRSGLFRQQTCHTWIDQAMKLPPVDGTVGHGSNQSVVDSSIRKSEIRWISRVKPFEAMWDRLIELFHEANATAFGFDLWQPKPLQFTRYSAEEQEFYDWHEDLTWVRDGMCHRKLSMVVQLSDPDSYEGGDFELANHPADPQQVRMQGSVIVFPSFLRHRVTPVTKGVRYSLVGWMEGPKFR